MVDKIAIVVAIIFVINGIAMAKTDAKEKKDKKIGKNINDYTESDIYKLADQWDENDEEYDPDDYDDDDPRKPPPKMKGGFDPSKFNGDPMAMLKLAKKGKTIMIFVQVVPQFSKKEADHLTELWHQSLFNAQFQIQRYMVADRRAIFLVNDGSTAWEIKDYLIKQPECESVEFDNQKFPGLGGQKDEDRKSKMEL